MDPEEYKRFQKSKKQNQSEYILSGAQLHQNVDVPASEDQSSMRIQSGENQSQSLETIQSVNPSKNLENSINYLMDISLE